MHDDTWRAKYRAPKYGGQDHAPQTLHLHKLISELNQTATIAIGVLETIKQMPDYDEAIERVKEQAAKQASEAKAVNSLEEIGD